MRSTDTKIRQLRRSVIRHQMPAKFSVADHLVLVQINRCRRSLSARWRKMTSTRVSAAMVVPVLRHSKYVVHVLLTDHADSPTAMAALAASGLPSKFRPRCSEEPEQIAGDEVASGDILSPC